MGQRRRAREYALQMLFQIDLTEVTAEETFRQFWSNQEASPEIRAFSESLVHGVMTHREALDAIITETAQSWRVSRMPVVDRNVLRMAIYEMQNDPATPHAVVIDEAIEVGKRFGTEESGGFINGILDAVRRRLTKGSA